MSGKGGTYRRAKKISERGAFVVGELFKLRRLRIDQVKSLIVDGTESGARFLVFRLEALGMLTREVTLVDGKPTELFLLTENGHKRGADSLGRGHSESYRDKVVFYSHLLGVVDLYRAIVAEGARDWTEVRERASGFEWYSSNEETQFYWQGLSELAGAKKIFRRLVPDVTIETEARRYLIEIEKSTKTQGVVAGKVEQYAHLFSPMKTAGERPAYFQKYGDEKKPVLLFVFNTERRAANAKKHFEKYTAAQGFPLPEWRCGTAASVGAYLRQELVGLATRPKVADNAELLPRESYEMLRRYVAESMKAIVDVQKAMDARQVPPRPRLPDCSLAVRDFLRANEPGAR